MAKAHFYLTKKSSSIAHGCLNNPLDTGAECSKIAKDRVLWEHSSGRENEKRSLIMREITSQVVTGKWYGIEQNSRQGNN